MWKKYFSVIFNFHFCEKPCFHDEFQALLFGLHRTLMAYYNHNDATDCLTRSWDFCPQLTECKILVSKFLSTSNTPPLLSPLSRSPPLDSAKSTRNFRPLNDCKTFTITINTRKSDLSKKKKMLMNDENKSHLYYKLIKQNISNTTWSLISN